MAALTIQKRELLSGFLGRLPEALATRLAKAVEVDRLIGGSGLPHEEILRALRPQLREVPHTQRTETPQRFFCRPFEDLLIGERKSKQKGRIARASLEPVWNWLANGLMPARHRELTEALRDAIVSGRESAIASGAAQLWSESAAVLKAALPEDARKNASARRLGSLDVAEDAAEIALVLGGAAEIVALQKRFPKPIARLSEGDIGVLRDAYERLSRSDPDLAPYVVLTIMGRLERPWEVLHLAAALSHTETDTVIANTDVGIAGELLFADLDTYVRRIQAVRPNDFHPEGLIDDLAGFAELSGGMVKELGIRRDGKWGQHIARARGEVAQAMEDLLERAPKEILVALPAVKIGGFGRGPKPLDLTRPPEPGRVARATRYAQLMMRARPYAVAGAFNAKLNETIDETSAALRHAGEDILREVRAATPETRPAVEQHLATALALSDLVLGEEDTAFLRRRARVPAHA